MKIFAMSFLLLLAVLTCTASDISCTENENCSTKCCENSICSAIENCELKSTIKTYVLSQSCSLSVQCSSIDRSTCCFYGKCEDSMKCFLNFELPPLLFSFLAVAISFLLAFKIKKAVKKKMEAYKKERINQRVEQLKAQLLQQIEEEKKNEKEEPLPDLISKSCSRYQQKDEEDEREMPNFEELDEYLLENDKPRSNALFEDQTNQNLNQEINTNISKQAFKTAKEGENAFKEVNEQNNYLNVPNNKNVVKRSKN